MTDVTITPLPAAPLHALEIWSRPEAVAARFRKAKGFALPAMGQSGSKGGLTLIRFEPTVWLLEGDPEGLDVVLSEDGALTSIGGGVSRVALSGTDWRRLLMEGGVFDAENPAFAPGCAAATVIDHVNIRLHATSAETCIAYVPASFGQDIIQFWSDAGARTSMLCGATG